MSVDFAGQKIQSPLVSKVAPQKGQFLPGWISSTNSYSGVYFSSNLIMSPKYESCFCVQLISTTMKVFVGIYEVVHLETWWRRIPARPKFYQSLAVGIPPLSEIRDLSPNTSLIVLPMLAHLASVETFYNAIHYCILKNQFARLPSLNSS